MRRVLGRLPARLPAVVGAAAWQSTTPGKVRVTFVQGSERKTIEAAVNQTLMEIARDHDVDMEAACDGTCACSTCLVHLDEATFEKLPEPSEDEADMLDLAPELKPTSRLACQVQVTKVLDGLEAVVPADISNQLS